MKYFGHITIKDLFYCTSMAYLAEHFMCTFKNYFSAHVGWPVLWMSISALLLMLLLKFSSLLSTFSINTDSVKTSSYDCGFIYEAFLLNSGSIPCCSGDRDEYIFSQQCFYFLWVNTQKWNCWIILTVLLFIFWGISILFSILVTFLPTVHESSLFLTSSPN